MPSPAVLAGPGGRGGPWVPVPDAAETAPRRATGGYWQGVGPVKSFA
jgi:hypothetical protein